MAPRTFVPSPSTYAEDPDRYAPGGLHPLVVGDRLKDGRYRVVHKLGSGSFATVWLARDVQSQAYVSLKILSASESTSCKELDILRDITESSVQHPGREYVVQLQDDFKIEGPNGEHLCLVTNVAGERLARKADLEFGDLVWPRKIGLQLAQALGYLHTIGIAHADCYTSNILNHLKPFDHWSEEEVYECMGHPHRYTVRRIDGSERGEHAPEFTYDPGNVAALEASLSTDKIMLIDLGAAFYHGEEVKQIFTPAPFAAPEILFSGKLTYAVDKWAFGCTLYELCADRSLIKLLFGWNNDAKKDQVSMLGKPPNAMWLSWPDRGRYFHEDGQPKEAEGRRLKVHSLSLEQRVQDLALPVSERGSVRKQDAGMPKGLSALHDLLTKLMVYEASARPSFESVEEHPFFENPRRPRMSL